MMQLLFCLVLSLCSSNAVALGYLPRRPYAFPSPCHYALPPCPNPLSCAKSYPYLTCEALLGGCGDVYVVDELAIFFIPRDCCLIHVRQNCEGVSRKSQV